jgi:hypothetical protein
VATNEGVAASADPGEDMLAPDDAAAQDGQDENPDAEADADAVAPPGPGEDDGAMVAPAAPDAALHPFYIEVERGPGVNEIIRIDATSPEQALAILRDHGDPQVVRGPSLQPLD